MSRSAFALLLVVLGSGCTGGSTPTQPATQPVTTAAVQQPVAAPPVTQPVAVPPAPAAPPVLQLGAPPVDLVVPAPPTFTFTVAQPGEYQIDVMGRPLDAQLTLLSGDQEVGADSDSGEESDARLITFLAPATYTGRVTEFHSQPLTARVQVQLLPPLTPAGTITPGQTIAVAVPQGTDRRNSAVEYTLTIAAAGNYRIDATATDFDAELDLIQGPARLAHSSDEGGNRNAQIRTQLAPGSYSLRVWDYSNRAGTINLAVAQE